MLVLRGEAHPEHRSYLWTVARGTQGGRAMTDDERE